MIMKFLAWWRQRRQACASADRELPEIVMLTRRGCHLCDDAWLILEQAKARYQFTLVARDVDADKQLQRDHGDSVPVVLVNGKVRFRGRVNKVLLARLLGAETSARQDL